MPALQTTVLKDRATTPVDHTFVPDTVENGVGIVSEAGASGVPFGTSKLSVSTRKLPSGKYKSEVRLSVPVIQTQVINGVSSPVLLRTGYANATFQFDQNSSEAERNNVVGMFADAFATGKVLVNDAVVKLQGIYR